MAESIYEIDPNADTAIILKNPSTSFAPWSLAGIGGDTTAFVEEPTVHDLTVNEHTVGDANQDAPLQDAHANSLSETNLADHCARRKEIWYRVSRSHLTLSSPIFERMLSETSWREGIRNEDDGLYHVTTEDWDREALLYVLQVLHHRNRQVPRTVSLEMLAKIAVLIDFFECAEALEPFTERWVERLRVTSPVPSYFCRDLILWMCVAWVLRLPREFAQTTTVAIRRGDEELSTLGLPITTCVDRIEESRRQAIGTVFSQLQNLLQGFRSSLYQCPYGDSFECGSMLFGALTKEMELQGLLPIPTAPYSGLSASELYTKMQHIRSPAWCRPGKPRKSQHQCDLREMVMAIADPVTRLANGPELKDFEFH